MDDLVGIYTEAQSVKCLDGRTEGKSKHDPVKLQARAAEIRAELLEGHALAVDDARAALEQLLPPGVSADDVLRLAGRIE